MPRTVFTTCVAREGSSGHPRRPPPGLKGKAIGLWYAAHSKNKRGMLHDDSIHAAKLDSSGIDLTHIKTVVETARDAGFNLTSGFLAKNSKSSLVPSSETSGEQTDIFDGGADAEEFVHDLPAAADHAFLAGKPLSRVGSLDSDLLTRLSAQLSSPSYTQMLSSRRNLPAYTLRQQIVDLIRANQIVVISGETGCGKTTQVPQFILEDEITHLNGSVTRIVVTQPRRISAISVAERVAAERGENLGVSVGYHVRLEKRCPVHLSGSITYLTTGMLLQWLHSDPLLESVSHVIIDEVHEREYLGDFLLTLLRNISRLRPQLHIILMSATMNSKEFSAYFNNCVQLDIPGRLFPVQHYFLEDVLRLTSFWLPHLAMKNLAAAQKPYLIRHYMEKGLSRGDALAAYRQPNTDLELWLKKQQGLSPTALQILRTVGTDAYPSGDLVAHLIDYILRTTRSGAVLVFLPGIGVIREVLTQLRNLNSSLYGQSSSSVRIYPLHSLISLSKQRGLFAPPPIGQRKLILATNIAETSITIEDVEHVVDCGRIKVTNYDPVSNTNSLSPVLVSRANATQRRGRAGRVKPGVCYHLFSNFVYEHVMQDYLAPEMLRMRLEEVILRIKLFELGPVSQFLSSCLSPPDPKAIGRTLRFLDDIGALDRQTKYSSGAPTSSSRQDIRRLANEATKLWNDGVREDGLQNLNLSGTGPSELPGDCAKLTPLGQHLAFLPMDPHSAKLVILGALFGCLEPALAVAVCLGYRDPFEVPLEQQSVAFQRRFELAQNNLSDHWVFVTILQNYRMLTSSVERRRFCEHYFIREHVVRDMLRLMDDHAALLYERRYISSPNISDAEANINKDNFPLFRAILCGALFPNIIRLVPRSKGRKVIRPHVLTRPSEGKVCICSRSVNGNVWPLDPVWMVYYNKTQLDNMSCPLVLDTTIIPLRPILFFAGMLRPKLNSNLFEVDNWIDIQAPTELVQTIEDLRACLDFILKSKFQNPGVTNWDQSSVEGKVLRTIIDLLASEKIPLIQTQRYQWERTAPVSLTPGEAERDVAEIPPFAS